MWSANRCNKVVEAMCKRHSSSLASVNDIMLGVELMM